MTITFQLPSNDCFYPACPVCKGTCDPEGRAPDPDCEHPDCDGLGPYKENTTPVLNVSNSNGMFLLRDILQYQDPDCGGSLPAADLSIRLVRAAGIFKSEVDEARMLGREPNFGTLKAETLARYLQTMAKIADLGVKRREPVFYG